MMIVICLKIENNFTNLVILSFSIENEPDYQF